MVNLPVYLGRKGFSPLILDMTLPFFQYITYSDYEKILKKRYINYDKMFFKSSDNDLYHDVEFFFLNLNLPNEIIYIILNFMKFKELDIY